MNAVLGWLFRGFNRGFDGMTTVYAWTIGKSLHYSPAVLLAYGVSAGVLTFWSFTQAPTGFIPEQDQGRLIASIQIARLGVAAAHQAMSWPRSTRSPTKPRRGPHDHQRRHLVLLQANSPNLASMFVILKPFDRAAKPRR